MAYSTGTKDTEDANSSRRNYNLVDQEINELWKTTTPNIRRGKKGREAMKETARWDVATFDGKWVWGE